MLLEPLPIKVILYAYFICLRCHFLADILKHNGRWQ